MLTPVPDPMEVKDLLCFDDRRGIATEVLSNSDPLEIVRVADILARKPPAKVLIATGFFVGGKPETDGPPGAILLGAAFASMGTKVSFVSSPEVLDMIRRVVNYAVRYVPFSVRPEMESQELAKAILAAEQPDCLVAIEVCGRTAQGLYLNMRGQDISAVTPRMDCLFLNATADILTIGIGDGGNEIGFGSFEPARIIRCGVQPCVISTNHSLTASVSNWAVYALLAFLSRESGGSFVPDFAEEQKLVEKLVSDGAVDGFSGENKCMTDGRSSDIQREYFKRLSEYCARW